MRVTARLVWITWAVGLLAVIALAAPGPLVTGVWAQEEGPTATATHFLGPTYTPTPTLPPPPPGGGLVNTTYLAVLPDPAVGSGYLGELPYGAPVHPVARSEDGDWVAIEWPAQNPERGAWISAAFVTWDAALDLGALPVLQAPYSITPVPSLTPTVTDTPEPSSTPEPSPTEARGGETAAPTETPQPAPAVIQPTPTSATSALPPSPGPALPGWLPIAIAGGLAAAVRCISDSRPDGTPPVSRGLCSQNMPRLPDWSSGVGRAAARYVRASAGASFSALQLLSLCAAPGAPGCLAIQPGSLCECADG